MPRRRTETNDLGTLMPFAPPNRRMTSEPLLAVTSTLPADLALTTNIYPLERERTAGMGCLTLLLAMERSELSRAREWLN